MMLVWGSECTGRRMGSVVATTVPGYIVAEFKNDAGVGIRVHWKENGMNRSRDIDAGETGTVEIVHSDGYWMNNEMKFTAMRKDNGETVLLNGGDEVLLIATKNKAGQSVVATNKPGYIIANFKNDAGVGITVQWKENGMNRSRDIDVGETGTVEIVHSDGDWMQKEVKFRATRKDNGEAILLNGGKDVLVKATSDRSGKSVVATTVPGYIVAEFKNDAGVGIRVHWKENGMNRSRDIDAGETGTVEIVHSDGYWMNNEMKFTAMRKDNGETVLLNGGDEVLLIATRNKAGQSVVATNKPGYIIANFKNDAGVGITVQWKENGMNRSRDIDVGETGTVEIVHSDGDWMQKEVKFRATRKDNGEAILLNGGKDVLVKATSDRSGKSVVATTMPGYIVAEFKNDAGVGIRVHWKENGMNRSRDIDAGETGTVEIVHSDGYWMNNEMKFTAMRKDNGETVLLNGGDEVLLIATKTKAGQSVVATNKPGYIIANFKNDAGVGITVQWKENGMNRSRDIDVGETGTVEIVHSDGYWMNNEMKFTAMRKDNGETVLLNGGDEVLLIATKNKAGQSVVATNKPGYSIANFKNDAGVGITVQWKENGMNRSRDIDVGETGTVEIVHSDGDWMQKEVKFRATRKDNGEAILLNGGKDVLVKATSDRSGKSVVATTVPGYIVAEFKNDAGVGIRVHWKENGMNRSRDIDAGETGTVEIVHSDGYWMNNEMKFTAMRKDNGETVLLNGGDEVLLIATRNKAGQSVVATNKPGYIIANFKNDAGVGITVQWKENGMNRSRDIDVGETGTVEIVHSDGDWMQKEVKFRATRKDNGEAILLNGGKDVLVKATSDRSGKSVVATTVPGYIVAEFKNDAGVGIRVHWKENGMNRSRDIDAGETGTVEIVHSDGYWMNNEMKFTAMRKDNGETVLLNGGDEVLLIATKTKAGQSVVATNKPGYIIANFKNDAGVGITVQWKENGMNRSRDIDVGETGTVEIVHSDGYWMNNEMKFTAMRKDNGETVLLNRGDEVLLIATKNKAGQSVVATNKPGYSIANFKNDAGVGITVQWKENGMNRSRDIDVGETGTVEIVHSDGDWMQKEVKFRATRKDNGEAILLNGGKDVLVKATSDRSGKSVVATTVPGYIVAEFKNDAGVGIRVHWKENGMNRSRDIDAGETGTVEIVHSDGYWMNNEMKFTAMRKDNGETVLLNGGDEVLLIATRNKAGQSVVATNKPGYIIANFKNDAGVGITVQWKENGMNRSRDIDVGETGTVEIVHSDGDWMQKEVKFRATRKDNGEAILLNGGKDVLVKATSDRSGKSVVATTVPGYIVAEFKNDAGVGIRVHWKENGMNRSRDIDAGETGTVEIVHSDGYWMNNEMKFTAMRKDNGETVLLNGGDEVLLIATKTKAGQSVVATNKPGYIIANFKNDAGVGITVQWKENGMNRSRDIDVGETGTVEIVHSDGYWMNNEMKFTAMRKDNGETVLLNGGDEVLLIATKTKAGQSVVATNKPGYIIANFKNDAGVGITVQWKENGMNRSRDIDVGETGTVEIVHSDGYWMNNEMKFTAMRKDNGETVLLNGGDEVLLIATKNKAGQSVVATNKPGYSIANFKNDAGVGITVQWKENGMNRSRDIDVGETGTVEIVHSDGDWMQKEVKFRATRKDNGEAILLNGGKDVLVKATSDRSGKSVVATTVPGYIVAEFKNDAGVGIRVHWKENGMNRSRDIDAGETGTVEIVHSDGYWMNNEMKFTAMRKDNGETVLLNGGDEVLLIATRNKAGQSVVATNKPGYIIANFKNDAGVGITVQWKENGMNRSRDIDVGETGTVEIVHSDGYWMNNEMKFTAMRKDNGETVLLNGGDEVLLIATKNKAGQSVVATNKPGYSIANFKNDAGVGITLQWKENGMNRSRDIDVGETGTVEIVHSDGDWMQKEVKFRATRKENGEAILLNGGKDILVKATSDRSGKSVVATTVPGYIVAEFKNDAGVGIRVHWKENGMNRSRDIDAGETGTVEIVHSDGYWMNNEMKFTAMRKDNGETVLLNGGDEVLLIATKNKAGQSVVATNKPGYIIANIKNDAGVGIRVHWKENGMNRSRDIDAGETGTVEIVHSDGYWMNNEMKFTAMRKDNGETVLLNGGDEVLLIATRNKAGQSVVATNKPGYIIANFKNDAGVGITVQWKENGMNRSRDIDVGETGTVEIVHSDGYWMNNEMKFTAMRKDNGETVLLNGGDEVLLIATKNKAGQSVVATNKPGYSIANFKNDAGVGITVQWKENGMNRSRDIDVGETGTVEIVHSDGDWMQKEVKFRATRKDNGEAILLNGGKDVLVKATSDRSGKSVVATTVPGYIVAEFKNDAGVGIRVHWKENGMNRSRDIDAGETGTVEIVHSDGYWMNNEMKFTAMRKDNGETVLLNGGDEVLLIATKNKAGQSVVATNKPGYIIANFKNDAGVGITVQWKENGMNRSRDIDVGETGTVEIVHSDGYWMNNEMKFTAMRKDNGETVLLNGGDEVLLIAAKNKAGQSVVATNKPEYSIANFKNDAGVGITVQWKENWMNRSRDIDVGETGTVEIVHSDGDWMQKEVKFRATRKDNGEAILLNGGKDILVKATSDRSGKSVVATTVPGYIVAEFKNDAGVGIRVHWKENGMNRSRDIDAGETGTVEIVHSDGYWMNNEMKFTAMRKDNGETVLLNGGDEVLLIATKNKAGQSVVATNKPGYSIANFKNDAGVGITVQWKENGMNRSRDIDVGETGTVEIVHSDGDWMQKEVKFRATRKDNGEAILLNGGKDVLVKATSDRSGKSVVATTVPGYIVAEFKNDAGVGIRVHWKENGMNRSRDIDAGETGTVEIVHSDGYWMNNEMKFTAMRKDNGETVLLNGGDEVLLIATKNKAGQSVVATNKPGYIIANFKNDAGVGITVQWKENGMNRSRDIDVGETGTVEIVHSDGYWMNNEMKFTAMRKDNGETVLLNGGDEVLLIATRNKAGQSVVATNKPEYSIANFKNDAGVGITVQWKENGMNRSRDIDVGETGTVEIVHSDGDWMQKEVKFRATRKDNGEAILLNGGKDILVKATSDRSGKSVVATTVPGYIVAEFKNDAGVGIRVHWKENGMNRSRDIDAGETGTVEIVHSDGYWMNNEMKFTAMRKDNGETVLLNGGDEVLLIATKNKAGQSVVATNKPGYSIANFKNDAGVGITVQWKENGMNRSRDIDVGETGTVEIVHSDGDWMQKEVKFRATRKDNGEAILLNGGKDVLVKATSDRSGKSVVATTVPGYIVAEFKNDAGVGIRVHWKENGMNRSRDIDAGETGTVEIVHSDGYWMNNEMKFTAMRKDNGETVLLNGGDEVLLIATKNKAGQSVVATNKPGYIIANFKNDAGVGITVQWKENGMNRSRDIDVGETGTVEIVHSDGYWMNNEMKFTAMRKDNGETVLLNGGDEVLLIATKNKAGQSVVATNKPGYSIANFKNDAGVGITVQWKENGMNRSRDIDVGETGTVEIVHSDGEWMQKEVKFRATRKDNGEAILLNGGKDVVVKATSDRSGKSVVATTVPGYIVAEFKNDAGVGIRVHWKENGMNRSRDIDAGETGTVEIVHSDGYWMNNEMKFTAMRKDNGETVLLNGGDEVLLIATKNKAGQSVVATNKPGYIIANFKNDAGVGITVQWNENGINRSREVAFMGSEVVEIMLEDFVLGWSVKFSAFSNDMSRSPMLLNGMRTLLLSGSVDRNKITVIVSFPFISYEVFFINRASGPASVEWTAGDGSSRVVNVARSAVLSRAGQVPVVNGANMSFIAYRSDTRETVLVNDRQSLVVSLLDLGFSFKVTLTDLPRYVIVDFANNVDGDIVLVWSKDSEMKRMEIKSGRSFHLEVVFSVASRSHPMIFYATRKDSQEPVNLNGSSSVTLVPSLEHRVYEIIATDIPKKIELEIINKVKGSVVLLWILEDSPMAVNIEEGSSIDYSLTLKGLDATHKVVFTARRTDYDLSVNVNRKEKLEVVPQAGITKQTIVISDKWLVVTWIDIGLKNAFPSDDNGYVLVELFTKVNGPFSLKIAHQGREKSIHLRSETHNRLALIFKEPNSEKPVVFTGQRTDVDFPIKLNYGAQVSFFPNQNRVVNKVIVSDERIIVPWIDVALDSAPQIGGIKDPVETMYIMIDFVNEAAGSVLVTAVRNTKTSDIELPFNGTAKLSIALLDNPSLIPIAFMGRRRDTNESVSLNRYLELLYIPRKEKVIETVIVRDPRKYITLTFINRAAGNIKVAWIQDSVEHWLSLSPGELTRKEIIFDGSNKAERTVFTAIRTSDAAPVQLNGLNSITFTPQFERASQRVVATNAAKYIIVDLINEAKEPVIFEWSKENSLKSKIVDTGKTERVVMHLVEPFRIDRIHFTARKESGLALSVNNAGFVEVLPSYEKLVTEIIARNIALTSKLRYLDVTFRNKAPGKIEMSWREDRSQHRLQMNEGDTIRKSFSFRGPLYKPLNFTSKFVNTQGVVYINGATSISLTPSDRFNKQYITATSPHIYLKFTNVVADTAYTEWFNNGKLEKAVVKGKGFLEKLVLFNRPGDRIVLSGNISSQSERAVALYNGKTFLQVPESPQALSEEILISMGMFEFILIDLLVEPRCILTVRMSS